MTITKETEGQLLTLGGLSRTALAESKQEFAAKEEAKKKAQEERDIQNAIEVLKQVPAFVKGAATRGATTMNLFRCEGSDIVRSEKQGISTYKAAGRAKHVIALGNKYVCGFRFHLDNNSGSYCVAVSWDQDPYEETNES